MMKSQHHLLSGLLFFGMAFASATAQDNDAQITEVITASEKAHGMDAWNQKNSVEADVVVDFGGKKAVDGKFTFQAHGPKARYDMADGTVVVFDGKTAWVTPAEAANPRARFHVLTWPWFILAPFKMDGDGTKLSDMKEISVDGNTYETVLQEFESGEGDTPDDWYRLFINPKNNQLEAMSYIVTYGKETEAAEAQPSIVLYGDYADIDGVKLSQAYEFWLWDKEAQKTVGDTPKASATVKNIKFVSPDDAFYSKPEGAVEVGLPPTK